jgi:hypothetical protein
MTFEPDPPARLAQVKTAQPRTRWKQDDGAAIVLLSAVMLFLLGMAAFAVDLGWLWLNASRIQSAADAAALSGVTHLPADAAQAQSSAEDASKRNGWPVGGTTSLSSSVGADNTLDVTLTAQIDTYFLRVFGQPQVTIRREATAQYILPVPLGSPFNSFGDNSGNFWAAISGRRMSREHGDPFATQCMVSDSDDTWSDLSITDDDCDTPGNPSYRPEGFYYAIEVQPGTSSLTVQLYDPGYYEQPNNTIGAGDTRVSGSITGPEHTTFKLYRADSTPYDVTDNVPYGFCTQTYDALHMDRSVSPPVAFSPAPSWAADWTSLCTVTNPAPGLHILQVSTSGQGGANNRYGVNAVTAGPAARVYGIDSVGVYTNVAGIADLYLAEIKPVHAGKTLRVSFFDAGDATGGDPVLSIVDPDGNIAANCTWETRSGSHAGSSCAIHTTPGGNRISNDDWIDAEIDIPETYTCDDTTSTGCWWRVNYDYSSVSAAHDRTTWQIEVVGNPVRLIVDAP